MPVVTSRSVRCGVQLGQFDTRILQLALHLLHVLGVGLGGQGVGVLGHRTLPLRNRHLQVSGLFVHLAQMIVNRGSLLMRSLALRRFSSASEY